ncbi:ATP phosphoribosyltransferase [Chelatococcus asaccharovorans]|uniref:ATP phosphoribosyltransferase n=1 Tax=Chelatococcus asaccharovorans TaxID=28210 RepID=UPI00224C686E|nr:ATP phosphoribosyltransferase [Chelatococcus asaccharovorans]CAH1669070.1 ATP phosphoribosyltransferase [Chelatococcus asaccharovorans]CAH1679485.1 ATP phosphoribosyltransferase [Chelatococcus asaccharovorans]
MTAPLVLAVPSKGRLQENTARFFAQAGLDFVQPRGARNYRALISGVPNAEVVFLSAAEIVTQLEAGTAHLGVTGEDLIREEIADADSVVELLTPLGFGQANVVVAVPQAWIDVRSMADLDDVAADLRHRHGRRLRVATKYINLTRRFFAAHGIADYRIVESFGATEGAPASGTAELIVDITTTGTTLAANALKIVDDGVILRSEANLVASVTAEWGPEAQAAARTILSRIAAEEEARTSRQLRALLPDFDEALRVEIEGRLGCRLPFGGPDERGLLTIHAPAKNVFAVVDLLSANGADPVTVQRVDAVFRAANALSDRLFARIG